jgi:hypothetical protein
MSDLKQQRSTSWLMPTEAWGLRRSPPHPGTSIGQRPGTASRSGTDAAFSSRSRRRSLTFPSGTRAASGQPFAPAFECPADVGHVRLSRVGANLLWLATVVLLCASCTQSSPGRGSGSSTARSTPAFSARVAAAAKFCRWTISNSQYRTHTTPGSYVTRPAGSCPHAELARAVALADGLSAGGSSGTGVCGLLAPDTLYNAKRVAAQSHIRCGQGAIEPARAGSVPIAQRFSHLAAVLLTSSSPGPAHWSGLLVFAPPGAQRHLRDPRYASFFVAIAKLPSGRWAIAQIGYE